MYHSGKDRKHNRAIRQPSGTPTHAATNVIRQWQTFSSYCSKLIYIFFALAKEADGKLAGLDSDWRRQTWCLLAEGDTWRNQHGMCLHLRNFVYWLLRVVWSLGCWINLPGRTSEQISQFASSEGQEIVPFPLVRMAKPRKSTLTSGGQGSSSTKGLRLRTSADIPGSCQRIGLQPPLPRSKTPRSFSKWVANVAERGKTAQGNGSWMSLGQTFLLVTR